MFFKSRCYRGGKQHRFEARYTEHNRPCSIRLDNVGEKDIRSLITLQTYVHDVCIWCGARVKAQS